MLGSLQGNELVAAPMNSSGKRLSLPHVSGALQLIGAALDCRLCLLVSYR